MIGDEIPLERGLCCFYEMQREFERRGYPTETQAALCYEAGYQAGLAEVKSKVAKIFLPDKKPEWA
jgi:hypothetical protein